MRIDTIYKCELGYEIVDVSTIDWYQHTIVCVVDIRFTRKNCWVGVKVKESNKYIIFGIWIWV